MFLPQEVDAEYVRRSCAPCAAASGFPPHVMGVNPELLVRGYSGIGADDMAASIPPTWKAVLALGLVGLTLWATSRLIEPGGART